MPLERSHEIDLLLHDLQDSERQRLWRLARRNASWRSRSLAALCAVAGSELFYPLVPAGYFGGLLLVVVGGVIGGAVGTRAFCQPSAKKYLGKQLAAIGRCPTCGYDLTGNTSGYCPECGGQNEQKVSVETPKQD